MFIDVLFGFIWNYGKDLVKKIRSKHAKNA